ncbi:MAG: RHS repeat-associated core domain-containing protein [bacterium]
MIYFLNNVPIFSILRLIIVFIITFTLSTGITFPIISIKVSEKSVNSDDKKPDESDFCSLDEDYLQFLREEHCSKTEGLVKEQNQAKTLVAELMPQSKMQTSNNNLTLKYNISAVRTEQVSLVAGWNLISLPLNPANTSIASVLSSIEGKYTSVWAYGAGGWERYIVGAPGNNLSTMEPGRGYWIRMTQSATLTVTGEDAYNKAVQLRQGWNLVGYNSLVSRTREEALASIDGLYYSVWTYLNGGWLRHITGASGNNLTDMNPWQGYWINATQDCVWELETGPDVVRPEVTIVIVPDPSTPPLIGQTVNITVNAIDNVGVVSKTLTINGQNIPLNAQGQASYTSNVPSVFTAIGTATDDAGNQGQASREIKFISGSVTAPPTVSFTAPAENSEISKPTDLLGTVNDTDLIRYKLEYSVKGRNEFIKFAEGTSPIINGVLGKLDPTMIRNGLYDIKLTAEDASGNSASVSRTYQFTGEMKVGNFTMSFTDLSIPVAGIPITITRTYDSRNKTKGDFGICWTMDISNIELSESGVLGTDWQQTKSGGFLPTYSIIETKPHFVNVSYPDGKIDEFKMELNPSSQMLFPVQFTSASFSPKPGTFSKLVSLANNNLVNTSSGTGPIVLYDDWDWSTVYNPDRYQLTTEDGTIYIINQDTGLESITDTNGNQITFGPNGIIHSSGKNVTFTRDSEGRITKITDPKGNTISYLYDFYGDLIKVTDQEGNTTTFTYNSEHSVIDIYDPRGIRPARNEYDNDGRLIAHIDAEGNRIEYQHDINSRQEVIKDRLGNLTVYDYDDKGNVTRITNAYGHITLYTYDDKGNRLSETDALGNTTTYTYDAKGNLLTKTDPLGNVTQYTYNGLGKVLEIRDAKGNRTVNTYDTKGNLLSTTDPLGNTVNFERDTSGNATKITGPNGSQIIQNYNSSGHLISKTDVSGAVTNYTYDSNGNMISEQTITGQRTINKSYLYDKQNRLIEITDSSGSVSNEYNSIRKRSANIDRLGNRTEYIYDNRGNLSCTIYPDGTEENYTYDAEGRKLSFTDRSGRTTNYAYDKLGRLIKTEHPDGTSTQIEYDGLGRVKKLVDQRGNATTYGYDSAGRRTSINDALGNTTIYSYDANGNLTSMTNPNGNTTQYEYDANNNKIKTIFPDGTFISYEYSAVGLSGDSIIYKKTRETDQAGKTTQYEYDTSGRLIKVIDALGNETSYAYDPLGNMISQTDAKGHITTYEYDDFGRQTKRTLPIGMSETFFYDAEGNIISHTDFNGRKTNFQYDSNGRIIRKDFLDGKSETYTYNTSGKYLTITDNRGQTSFEYDLLDRVIKRTDPDGRSISYSYDPAGNRTSVTTPAGTTNYTYDALNRLKTVIDPDGGITTYDYDSVGNRTRLENPNGTYTEYIYDSLDRLTSIKHRKSDSTVISSYAYTLGPAGNITHVEENNGRIVNYTYDNIYRLTQENINGSRIINYTYDVVGNRLTKNDNGAITNYTYDNNDRLITEGSISYNYDNNGNLISKTSASENILYEYDSQNRLIKVTVNDAFGTNVTEYIYDTDGIRVQKTLNGSDITKYLLDKNLQFTQVLLETTGAGANIASYVYGDGLISQKRGASRFYYHIDKQMTVRLLTNSAQNITDTYVFDAFGVLLQRTGSTTNNYLFTGEQYDPNVGFYYLRARHYNPAYGRFISMDPWQGDIFEPATLHKYVYAYNNPLNYIDPTGKFGLASISISIAIFGILATIGYLTYRYYGLVRVEKISYDIYDSGNRGGVTIKLGAKTKNRSPSYPEYRWVQFVTTNDPLGGASANTPYNDPQPPDDDKPFYWTDAELPGYQNKDGYDLIFYDQPKRQKATASVLGSVTWKANLSLVGVSPAGSKTYTDIIKIEYGFSISKTGNVSKDDLFIY